MIHETAVGKYRDRQEIKTTKVVLSQQESRGSRTCQIPFYLKHSYSTHHLNLFKNEPVEAYTYLSTSRLTIPYLPHQTNNEKTEK